MNNEEKLAKILEHVIADADGVAVIQNDTNKSLHIDAIAYEPIEKGGLIAFGHNASVDQFFVASDLKIWTTEAGVEKVCWGGGAYFDSFIDALRYFRVFRDGEPVWTNDRYWNLVGEFKQSPRRIVSIDQITSAIWDWHVYECNRLKDTPKELTETQDLASYEIFLSKSLQYIMRLMMDGDKDADFAYSSWDLIEARKLVEEAMDIVRSWY